MKYIVLALLAVSMTACAPMPDGRATRALEAQGYTEIQFHGLSIFGCSEDDFFRKEFTAKGASGKVVEGVVCGGIFKGATVRTD
jgi:hypothetical protein